MTKVVILHWGATAEDHAIAEEQHGNFVEVEPWDTWDILELTAHDPDTSHHVKCVRNIWHTEMKYFPLKSGFSSLELARRWCREQGYVVVDEGTEPLFLK